MADRVARPFAWQTAWHVRGAHHYRGGPCHGEETTPQGAPRRSLHRNVIISSIAPSVGISMKDANDRDPLLHGRPWLELRGYMLEPVRDIHEIVLKLWGDSEWRVGTVRPASVAHIRQLQFAARFVF